jgi:hypothetical protein
MNREDIIRMAREAGIDEFGSLDERLILFAALVAALEQPEQEPLSDEELDRLWREPMSADWEHREYARAVEAAHGIKENITGEREDV